MWETPSWSPRFHLWLELDTESTIIKLQKQKTNYKETFLNWACNLSWNSFETNSYLRRYIWSILGSLKAKINLFIYTLDLVSFIIMQSYLEWKKLQFKRSQCANAHMDPEVELVNFKTGFISLLSIFSFVALLLSNVFLSGKRMGHDFYVVEFFVSGFVFFAVVPLVVILRNENLSSYVRKKFLSKFIFLTNANNQVCPILDGPQFNC